MDNLNSAQPLPAALREPTTHPRSDGSDRPLEGRGGLSTASGINSTEQEHRLIRQVLRAGAVVPDDVLEEIVNGTMDDFRTGRNVRERQAAARTIVALRGQDIRQAHYTRNDDRNDRQDNLSALRAMLATPEMAAKLAELLPDVTTAPQLGEPPSLPQPGEAPEPQADDRQAPPATGE